MAKVKQVKHVQPPENVLKAFNQLLLIARQKAGDIGACWLWPVESIELSAGITKSSDGDGYGQLRWVDDQGNENFFSAHRLAYFVTHELPQDLKDYYGEIGIENLSSMERFDAMRHDEGCGSNKACFNPSHITRGDAILNSLDKYISKIRDKNWEPSKEELGAGDEILSRWRETKDFRELSRDKQISIPQWKICRILHQWGGKRLSFLLKNPRLND